MSDALLLNADALHIPLADGSVQMVITSPPYYNAREEYASWLDYPSYLGDMAKVWQECCRVLCNGGRIAVNVPEGYDRTNGYKTIGSDTINAIQQIGFTLRGVVIWNKSGEDGLTCINSTAWGSWCSASNPIQRDVHEIIVLAHKGSPYRRPAGQSTITPADFMDATKSVWNILPISHIANSWHPAPFPAEIPRRLIELYTYKGDTVLDPFSGSGTTVKVAKDLGRHGIGIDLSYEYLDHSRWDTYEYRLERWQHGKRDGASVDDLPLFSGASHD